MFTVKTLDEMGFKDKERSDFLATYSGSTSRARFATGLFLIEKHQCHNQLGCYLQQNHPSYLVINDLEPCLEKCRKSLKEFILANHFADDSPWSELFEYMELFEHNGSCSTTSTLKEIALTFVVFFLTSLLHFVL